MTDGDALFAAILAHPEEDTPRLAYADWLDERGGRENRDRAEFIRLQIELSKYAVRPRDGIDPVFEALEKRQGRLESKYKEKWERPLVGRDGPLFGDHAFTNFNRGFVDRAGGTAARWVRRGDEVFRLAPVTYVSVDDLTNGTMRKLAKCSWLDKVRIFEISTPHDYSDWEDDTEPPDFALLGTAPLANLKHMWFEGAKLTPAGAARVAAATAMPRLEGLRLYQVDLSAKTVANLFGGKAFANLRELDLSNCDLGPAELAALAGAKDLGGLKKLCLPWNAVGEKGIAALARAKFWRNLKNLELHDTPLWDTGAVALAATLGAVEELNLNECGITGVGVAALAAGKALRRVKKLDLSRNLIGDEGAVALARCPHLDGLVELNIDDCGIGTVGAVALAGSAALAGLKELQIYGNPFGAKGYAALAASPHLGGLECLWVSNVRGDARKRLKERFGDRVVYF